MVTRSGRAKVTDFGLARRGRDASQSKSSDGGDGDGDERSDRPLDVDYTAPGSVMGTPAFMSPEQFRGGPLTDKSDQFSFCVSAYRALFGGKPFAGTSLVELSGNVFKGNVAPPPADSQVPASVRDAIMRGLSPDPPTASRRWWSSWNGSRRGLVRVVSGSPRSA